MKTIEIKLYDYAELSQEAKDKALATWREYFDDYALTVHLDNRVQELLEDRKITPVSTSDKKYESKYAKLYYSLSNCQGDGVMFEGTFEWKGWTVNIKQSGHYNHSFSKVVEFSNDEGAEFAPDKIEEEFEVLYQEVCKDLEREGYAEIENIESEEAFIDACDGNEYTFREDGTMENDNQ